MLMGLLKTLGYSFETFGSRVTETNEDFSDQEQEQEKEYDRR